MRSVLLWFWFLIHACCGAVALGLGTAKLLLLLYDYMSNHFALAISAGLAIGIGTIATVDYSIKLLIEFLRSRYDINLDSDPKIAVLFFSVTKAGVDVVASSVLRIVMLRFGPELTDLAVIAVLCAHLSVVAGMSWSTKKGYIHIVLMFVPWFGGIFGMLIVKRSWISLIVDAIGLGISLVSSCIAGAYLPALANTLVEDPKTEEEERLYVAV